MAPGFKYNLTDVAAALGLRQLTKQDRFRAERASIAARYDAAFGQLPALETPTVPEHVETAWHLYLLRLNLDSLSADRARVIEALAAENVLVRDPETGLVDFPGVREGRPVFLCWRLGEDAVAHWHDVDSGFLGRRPL
jgi:dTDP-4-amino-4,6-dideoxygalactose transaminase